MAARSKAASPGPKREGDRLRIGRAEVVFGRNIIAPSKSGYLLQPRLFVNDPWALIAEAIARAAQGRPRDMAQSFRRQAEDYFRAATIGHEAAVRPVLLYYAFLNLSKAFSIVRGNLKLVGSAGHGCGSPAPKPRTTTGALIKFQGSSAHRPSVFDELLQLLDGDRSILRRELRLGYLLPQILPGHRLWCLATDQPERFITIQWFELLHSPSGREVWLNIVVERKELVELGLSEDEVLVGTDLGRDFELVVPNVASNWVYYQQRRPAAYSSDPGEAVLRLSRDFGNKFWETVRVESPYRKPYLYFCPAGEKYARLPQMLSTYVLMFFLGSVTRYVPGHFEDLLESKYGPLIETFVSESPTQFLYLMASDILGREVSKPAII